MNKKLYVGNLNRRTTAATLLDLFGAIGEVVSVKLVTDCMTGRSRGFAFVKMANKDDAQRAIDQLNGRRIDGKNIKVAAKRPRKIPELHLPWGLRGHKPPPRQR
jgi:RNA recognition motif-containing protein